MAKKKPNSDEEEGETAEDQILPLPAVRSSGQGPGQVVTRLQDEAESSDGVCQGLKLKRLVEKAGVII